MKWIITEIEYLKGLNGTKTAKELQEILDRKSDSIAVKCRELNIKLKPDFSLGGFGNRWSPEEIDFLEKNHDKFNGFQLANVLKRPHGSVYVKLRELGLNPKKNLRYWTQEEIEYLKNNCSNQIPGSKIRMSDIGKILGRSFLEIRRKAISLGLYKPNSQLQWGKANSDRILARINEEGTVGSWEIEEKFAIIPKKYSYILAKLRELLRKNQIQGFSLKDGRFIYYISNEKLKEKLQELTIISITPSEKKKERKKLLREWCKNHPNHTRKYWKKYWKGRNWQEGI